MPAGPVVDEGRVRRVAAAIAGVGAGAVVALEELDPQFHVAKRVVEAMGPGPGAAALVLAALTAYRLAVRGEEYWLCFASTVEEWTAARGRPEGLAGAAEAVREFLVSCPGARVQREAKLRRLARAARAPVLARLAREGPRLAVEDPEGLARGLASALGQKPQAKTIVFAVKMAYYAWRPRGLREPAPIYTPIPVDVRVACLTQSSGITVHPKGYRGHVSQPEAAQEAWSLVSRLSRVPTVHLDALAWMTGALVRDNPNPRAAITELLARAGAPRPSAERLALELTWRNCP